jgi:glycosyltransferase involved in cell wall biosynthesis
MSKKPVSENQIPIVSIILPTFNRGKYITDAIESVLSMSFKDWELIIVDDGSKDQTNIIIRKYLEDKRIHYLYKEINQGQSFARNLGLQKSKGKYIAYIDSDNTYSSDFMSLAIEFLEKNKNCDLVYGSLSTSLHGENNKPILFKEFSRRQLLEDNYIDLNTVIHRRKLYELFGGFDESIDQSVDWDLILKYTQNNDAKSLAVLAVNYRELDELRITKNNLAGTNRVKILSKWPPRNINISPLKVLYVLNSYPQLSESYVEYELRKMRDWGFEIEVWRMQKPHSPYHSDIQVHDEDLREVVSKIKPDLIHIHWLGLAKRILPLIDDLNIPTTIRAHSFDTTEETIRFCSKRSFVKKIYCFPQHIDDFNDAKLEIQNTVFDTKLFKPYKNKNKRLVVRGGAALPSKSLPFFIHLAKELPEFKFILAVVKCHDNDDYINELKKQASSISSPVEIKINLPRESYAELVSEAGIYLNTVDKKLMNVGMPISISEAMASGCYIVASNYESMKRYIGESGKTYNDMNEAKKIIKDTELWSNHEWNKIYKNSAERAFFNHSDEIILRPMFYDWTKFTTKNQSNTTEDLELQNNKQSKIIERLEQEIKRLEQEIKKVMNSNSYKYAEPLRKLRRIASSLINRLIN